MSYPENLAILSSHGFCIQVRPIWEDHFDLSYLHTLSSLVKERFPITAEFAKKKRLLSGKEDDIWVCSCKTKNEMEVKYCEKCRLDKYGFKEKSVNPPIVLEYLEGCIEFMETL